MHHVNQNYFCFIDDFRENLINNLSRNKFVIKQLKAKEADGWKVHLPKFEYCTDNGAMIAIAGKFLFDAQQFGELKNPPSPRLKF